MTYVQILVTGILLGGVYAISGLGIVLTYKATGVFNLAHFTIALFAAYVLWQLNGVWHISLWISAPFVLLVVSPGIGIVLERFVFRSLQRRRASTSEKLVANLGLVVLFLGLINIVWGSGVKGNVKARVPKLWPDHQFHLGGVRFDSLQLAYFIAAVGTGVALYALLRYTFLGTKIQAVVDRRELAELSTIDANRVSMVAWAIGCGLAGLTGVLLAPPVLEPNKIILFGIEMLSVAVVARLVSLPLALLSGLLLLGGAKDLLASFAPFGNSGFWSDTYAQLTGNFSVVVLFVALLAYRHLDEVGESAPTGQGLVATELGRRNRGGPSVVMVAAVMIVGVTALALLMLLFALNLRSGRLGRILGAMRDSETAAKAIGIDLRRYKLFIFAASSFIAGIGGAMLSQSQGAWDSTTFNPLFSLFWFVAVTVAGISTLGGGILAAVIYVMLPLVINQDIQSAVFFLGVGALFLGRLPGGLLGVVQRIPARLTTALSREYVRAQRAAREAPEGPALEPSAVARALVTAPASRNGNGGVRHGAALR